MGALRSRVPLVLFLILTSPVAAFAAGITEEGDSMWDWLVRLLAWAAGGWHYY